MMKLNKLMQYVHFFLQLPFTLFNPNFDIFSSTETIDKLIKSNKSLIRLGDGETLILNGKDIHYQQYNDQLGKEMKMLVDEYNVESNYILALPKPFLNSSIIKLKSIRYIKIWTQARYYFNNNISKDKQYGDSFCFSNKNNPYFYKLFERNDEVIFIHNSHHYCSKIESIINNKCNFIAIPRTNSFSVIDDLEKKVVDIGNMFEMQEKKYCVVISAGPMGKVLAYRLAKQGITSYDTGHCWDEPLYDPSEI